MIILSIIRTTSQNPNFTNLVKLLDADLKIRDGEDHAFYARINQTAVLNCALVCYRNDVP